MLRKRPVYYKVFAMKDGTVLLALPGRKPSKASLYKRERIDEDGIYRWYVHNNRDYMTMRDWNSKPFETIANCLNFRRALRAQVEPKLDELQEQVAALKQQLDRIEEKLPA